MVASPEVHPFHPIEVFSELLLEDGEGPLEGVGAKLAEVVEVEAGYSRQGAVAVAVAAYVPEVLQSRPEPRVRSAGVVDRDLHLPVFRVHPDAAADRLFGLFDLRPEPVPLGEGVKDHVVGVFEEKVEFLLSIGRRRNVNLATEHLKAEPGLVDGACGNAGKVLADEGEEAECGKALQGQEYLAAGPLLDRVENLQVVLECGLVQDVAGRRDRFCVDLGHTDLGSVDPE